MKFGFRKPSLKKSIKARTTGRVKRSVKRAIIPAYGKKGTGLIKNPKKAMYNKVYNKTTIDGLAPIKKIKNNNTKNVLKSSPLIQKNNNGFKFSKTQIKKNRSTISKNKQVHFLDRKANCCLCNKNLNLTTFRSRCQLIDGWLCTKCLKKITSLSNFQRKAYTVEQVKKFYTLITTPNK